MLMASQGQKMAAMFHNQGNPALIMSGTRCVVALAVVCMREITDQTIHPVGTSGNGEYYLPDQDHGPEHSEFVDFFATYKATLPAIGRLMKCAVRALYRCFRFMMARRIV